MQEREYYLGFSVFPGIGPKRFHELLRFFRSAEKAWHADEPLLIPILGDIYTKRFLNFRESFSFETYRQQLETKDVWFVTIGEDSYPKLLSQIENPPFVLYGKGDKNVLLHPGGNIATDRISGGKKDSIAALQNDIYIGVVGTRKITSYGQQVTEMITEELVSAGCVIVSGLALGVDAVAHKTTLRLGGVTIAVLGSGVDMCHPSSNAAIYTEIISSGGVVLSEYPLGEQPSRGSFPSRNRIIAGLSHGVIVTEGAAGSGALITASDALQFGRRVYAVPGPITSSLSHGPNSLLLHGAKLVMRGSDILEDIGMTGTRSSKRRKHLKGETEEEQHIIDYLHDEELSFDEMVKRIKSDAVHMGTVLSMMELRGVIEQKDGKYRLRT